MVGTEVFCVAGIAPGATKGISTGGATDGIAVVTAGSAALFDATAVARVLGVVAETSGATVVARVLGVAGVAGKTPFSAALYLV